ncbi:AbiTii domain-containing protein [Chromohalobacter israelensis]|uniref:AbiTii domain-containing protein n=1 Tax=Chromohalobacter israelensis TaxID=141390 RepID=UPI000FFF2204|nr:hypothetical protein [Chromohalobacter salexigens]RXE49133.1 hypothetical protein B4O83_14605 [Chromohalobacter salexigens]
MSLLREIQDAAVDSYVPLSTLLRKCKVLAARLGNEELKQWVDHELNGYGDRETMPEYRHMRVNSKGHFSGPFQSGLRNADIPMGCIPEKFRENLSNAYLMQPVAALENLVENSEGGTLQEPWSPDVVAYFGQDIYEGMNCMQAWKVIPVNAVVAALDSIRNRILNFALEIESIDPDVGESAPGKSIIDERQVQQVFNTYITGDVQNMATGSSNFTQNATMGERDPEIFANILQALRSVEGKHSEAAEVAEHVEEMRDSSPGKDFGEKYSRFMSLLSDHMQVLGPVVAPYLPALAALAV